jgi:hypothetical protein
MAKKISGRDAKQGDRGSSMARALIFAMVVAGIVTVGILMYAAYFGADEPDLELPPDVTEEPATDSQQD